MHQHQNGGEEEPAPPFEIKDIIYGILRAKLWIGCFAVVGVCGGVYLGATKPNVYTSRAKLHLRLGARESKTSEDLVGVQANRLDTRTGIEDEIHLLTAESLYERLARKIGPEEVLRPADPKRHNQGEASLPKRLFHELQARVLKTEARPGASAPGEPVNEAVLKRAATDLMKNTVVFGERGSNVISVTYTSTSAEKAQEHLDLILETYIERHLEQYSMVNNTVIAEKKMNDAAESYRASQASYFAHLGECNLPDADEALAGMEDDIRLLKGQIFDAAGRREDIAIESEALRKRIASMPETIDVAKPAVTRPNEERETALNLKSTYLSRKEELQFENMTIAERQDRQEFYDTRIASLEKEIEEMPRLIVEQEEAIETLPNEERQDLQQELEDLHTEDQILVMSIERLTSREETLVKDAESMLNCKFTHLTMTADMEEKHRVFNGHATTYDDFAGLASLRESNLTILEPASLATDKSGPSRAKIVMMWGMMGVMFAGGLAVLRQLLDPKVRYPHVASRTMQIPVIAIVSERRFLRGLRNTPRPEQLTR